MLSEDFADFDFFGAIVNGCDECFLKALPFAGPSMQIW